MVAKSNFNLQLKNWRVDSLSSVTFEDSDDLVEDSHPQGHLLRRVVPCALGGLEGELLIADIFSTSQRRLQLK